MSATSLASSLVGKRGRTRLRGFGSSLGLTGKISVGILIVVVLMAAIGPLIVRTDPNALNLAQAFGAPSVEHPLGQDANGRDLLARLVVGSRTALLGPLLVVVLSTIIGTVLALVAAWRGGAIDTLFARVIDAIFAFPGLLLAILVTALFGPGLTAAVAALSVAYTPYMARIVRSGAIRERHLPYVDALRVQGISPFAICTKHIVPNIGTLIVANATLSFGMALIDLAGLSFIGLGVQAPTADWGAMVGSGLPGIMQRYPQEAFYASLLIVATVFAANQLGGILQDRAEGRR